MYKDAKMRPKLLKTLEATTVQTSAGSLYQQDRGHNFKLGTYDNWIVEKIAQFQFSLWRVYGVSMCVVITYEYEIKSFCIRDADVAVTGIEKTTTAQPSSQRCINP